MPVNVNFHGTVYPVPLQGDKNWGAYTSRYLVALGTYSLTSVGGLFTLTNDINFGPTFGLLSKYFTSTTTLPATAGSIRLAKTDTIDWRNNANSGENVLAVNGSDQLTYNGAVLSGGFNTLADGTIWIGSATNVPVAQTLTGDVTVTDLGVTSIGALKIDNSMVSATAGIVYSKLALTGSIVNNDIGASASIVYSKLNLGNSIVNADINTAAAIAFTKLAALNNSIVPVTNGSGVITSSTVTATQLGYVDATSSIQTQINSKQATLTGTANQIIITGATLSTPQDIATSSTPAFAGLTLGQTGLILQDAGVSWLTLKAPASVGSNYTIQFPSAVSAPGGVLTDVAGNGITSWVVPSDSDPYLLLTGGTLTGDVTLANAKAIIFKELTGSGTDSVTLRAPDSVTTSWTIQLPPAVGAAGSVPTDVAGNGILTMVVPTGSGTVNAGTQFQLAYYATSTNAVSGLTLITANRALISDANGLPIASTVTNTTLAFLDATSSVQTQINGKRATFANGQLPGTATNDSATAGNVGEYISSSVDNAGAAFSAATGQYKDITSISLTAGDWSVSGQICLLPNSAIISFWEGAISTTAGNSVTGLVYGSNELQSQSQSGSTTYQVVTISQYRISLASTTTVYLKEVVGFSAGAPLIFGTIRAWRMR